jgi:hypothetical protein
MANFGLYLKDYRDAYPKYHIKYNVAYPANKNPIGDS